MIFEIKNPVPALQFRSTPTRRSATNEIVLHHYAHPTKAGQQYATVHDVHRWHLNAGKIGIGYNLVVNRDGSIIIGRGMDAVGAHTYPPRGINSTSVGIGVQGNFDSVNTYMPDAQFNALVWLIKHIRGIYGNIPIRGHREVPGTSTACPGRFFPIDEIRRLEYRVQEDEDVALMKAIRSQPGCANVTEEDVAKALAGALRHPLPSGETLAEYERAIEAGVTDGTNPHELATRWQVALMASRRPNNA